MEIISYNESEKENSKGYFYKNKLHYFEERISSQRMLKKPAKNKNSK